MLQSIRSIDSTLLTVIHGLSGLPLVTPLARFLSLIGDLGAVWVVLAFAVLLFKRNGRNTALATLVGLLAVEVLSAGLKLAVARPRPPLGATSAQLGYSFPSTHTSRSFVAAKTLSNQAGRLFQVLLYLLATLIGLSRLILGVHYPSDVVAGGLLGYFVGWVLVRYLLPALPQERLEED